MKLSKEYTEIVGVTHVSGEEECHDLMPKVTQLEEENEALRKYIRVTVTMLPDNIVFVDEQGYESELGRAWKGLPQDLRDALLKGDK